MQVHRRFASVSAALASVLVGALLLTPPASADNGSTPTPEPVPTTAPTDPAAPSPEPAPTPPPETAPAAPVVVASALPLRIGARGWRVRHVQERLAWLGYEIYPTNLTAEVMGKSTAAAVKAFQQKFGARPTGFVGDSTWELLDLLANPV
ncbi:MAG: peptidoglycan-binding domain-containing protein, partial [Actinobacteria bacterium]|nr:peptidoglycan-binding domain-containing protein [Actinomycetota bacterium]